MYHSARLRVMAGTGRNSKRFDAIAYPVREAAGNIGREIQGTQMCGAELPYGEFAKVCSFVQSKGFGSPFDRPV
jgi:hypothetical protein